MRANELRIGNYINEDILGDSIISSIHKNFIEVGIGHNIGAMTYTLNYTSIKPIQLTEEWLLDFGFEKDELGWFFKENDYCSFGLFFKDNEWLFYISDTKIKYVHQLQNLYFALTNNELTNKLQM